MRGYPGCDPSWAERPAGCTDQTLYGDSNSLCNFSNYFSPDGNGYYREVKTGCDGGRGMIGSPVYAPNYPNGPAVFGQYNNFDCIATACAMNPAPNTMGLITQEYAGAIDYSNRSIRSWRFSMSCSKAGMWTGMALTVLLLSASCDETHQSSAGPGDITVAMRER